VIGLPPVGTRVSLRYQLPTGSVPPLSDVVGHLVEVTPTIRVRTKTGVVVDVSPADVVAVRALTDAPVRTSQIRNLEHAAALAWPGLEQHWLDGWLLRFSGEQSHRANSAVPLDVHATLSSLPAIVDWYRTRNATPWLAIPDRLLRLPDDVPAALESVVMTSRLDATPVAPTVVSPRPDERWMGLYARAVDVFVDVLTAVLDGELGFATWADAAVGRCAVTPAPDGTRWAGLAAVRVDEGRRREGHARALCSALLAWAAERGATQAYVQVLSDNVAAMSLYRSMGFTTQHRVRYVDGRTL
jgi:GNAT superfamily N-acetyltransferase